jgi:anti-anti-sigma factor
MTAPEFALATSLSPPEAELRIGGELDLCTRPRLTAALDQALDAGCLCFRIDLSRVTFVDAGCLGVIIGLRRRVLAAGGLVELRAPSATVVRVIEILGLRALLDEPAPAPRRAAAS